MAGRRGVSGKADANREVGNLLAPLEQLKVGGAQIDDDAVGVAGQAHIAGWHPGH